MVEVFKTSVKRKWQATLVSKKLREQFPKYVVNFDLADCDRVLRIESAFVNTQLVIQLLASHGFDCYTFD